MADHTGESEPSLMEKIAEKIHGHDVSSSDSDDDHLASTIESMKNSVYRLFGREKPVHKVLGGGKTADIFLWRDKKLSGGVLGGATVIWVLFELLEYHLVTLVCHLSILALAILFLWSNASTFINKAPPRIPDVLLPEECIVEVASALRIEANRGLAVLREIASGKDLKKFLAVVAGLWFVSILGSCFNFITLFYIVPLFYEKYEDQVDAFAEKAMVEFKKHYAVFDEKVLSKIPKGLLNEKKMD